MDLAPSVGRDRVCPFQPEDLQCLPDPVAGHAAPSLKLVNLKLEHKQLYARVFELFVDYPIDYVDAYHAALLERSNQTELLSFDKDFDGLPMLTRREP